MKRDKVSEMRGRLAALGQAVPPDGGAPLLAAPAPLPAPAVPPEPPVPETPPTPTPPQRTNVISYEDKKKGDVPLGRPPKHRLPITLNIDRDLIERLEERWRTEIDPATRKRFGNRSDYANFLLRIVLGMGSSTAAGGDGS